MSPDDEVVDDEAIEALGTTIEWAWERIRSLPRSDVPRPLAPMLGFRRLSGPAKRQIFRVLDDDESFRVHIAEGADDADIPALGRLWLRRPDEWRTRFDSLVDEANQTRREIERIDRQRNMEGEIARLEDTLAKAIEERDRAIEGAAEDRRRHEELKASIELLRSEKRDLRDRADRLERERQRAIDELQAARALAERRLSELKAATSPTSSAAKVRLDESSPQPRRVEIRDERRDDDVVATHAALASAIDLRREKTREFLEARLNEMVAELVAEVQRSFSALIDTVQPGRAERHSDETGSDQRAIGEDVNGTEPRRRQQLKLPGGVFDDSVEAAQYLLGAVDLWLVDGYNVTMTRWSSSSVEQQRDHLVRRLESIAAKTDFRIVFDGAEGEYFRGAGQRRVGGKVEVVFSPVGVEADDVIIELCASLPAEVSVVVVSNDQRVRDGARRWGANVVTVDQLFAISGGDR